MQNIINVGGIDCYEENGTAYLKLETVARGLGFTQTQNKNGNEYVSVRWERVREYLKEVGFPHKWGKDETSVPTCGEGNKLPEYIPENVFYRLAMKAKNETAEKFQAFVADEVIPSIRKHGAYMTPDKLEDILLNPDTLITLATELKKERAAREHLEGLRRLDKPKVIFADAVCASKRSILVGELAKLLKQNGVEIGQNRLFEWLRNNGFLISRKGSDYNMPTQKAMEMGLFEIKETAIPHSDGHITVSLTPKVSGKGQKYFVNRFLQGVKDYV